jgi:DNA-binding response OmpR family regulator
LEEEGFEVAADDGLTVEKYTKEPVDLVLLDIWMRGVDGRDISRMFKAAGNKAIVILMSAHSEGESAVVEARADGFLAKPFELDELVDVVRGYLDKRSKAS